MTTNPTIGQRVKRVANDYTNGRSGPVIELDQAKGRARVAWEKTGNGSPMKLKTWVRFADLEAA
jgi:hypothetical protein